MSVKEARKNQIIVQTFRKRSVYPALCERHKLRVQVVMGCDTCWVKWYALEFHAVKISCTSVIHKIRRKQRRHKDSNCMRARPLKYGLATYQRASFKLFSSLHRELCLCAVSGKVALDRKALSWFYRHFINYKLKLNFPTNWYCFHHAIDAEYIDIMSAIKLVAFRSNNWKRLAINDATFRSAWLQKVTTQSRNTQLIKEDYITYQ